MGNDSGQKRLRTAATVIRALGGPTAVARLTRRSPPQVCNMRTVNRFPPVLYVVMAEALQAIGASAPASLWGQVESRRGD